MYQETAQERRTFRDEGVLPVEMESSALGTGARGQGAEAAARFTVSDLRDETERPPRFHETRSRLGAQRDFAIGAVSRLARAGKTERGPLAEARGPVARERADGGVALAYEPFCGAPPSAQGGRPRGRIPENGIER